MTTETNQEAWEVSRLQGDLYTPEETRELYRVYAKEEGHLCVVGHFGDDAPDAAWYAWCANCHVGMLGTVEEVLATTDATVATWIEARDWTREHRASFGLPRQEVAPHVAFDELNMEEARR